MDTSSTSWVVGHIKLQQFQHSHMTCCHEALDQPLMLCFVHMAPVPSTKLSRSGRPASLLHQCCRAEHTCQRFAPTQVLASDDSNLIDLHVQYVKLPGPYTSTSYEQSQVNVKVMYECICKMENEIILYYSLYTYYLLFCILYRYIQWPGEQGVTSPARSTTLSRLSWESAS